MAKSLFNACKSVIRDGISGTKDVGTKVGSDGIYIEYYTQDDINTNAHKVEIGEVSGCTFGNNTEENVLLVADDTITIPDGFVLSPASPKKSMVILCNTLINNGTISMVAKAPCVLPHDWYIIGKPDGYAENVVIPAYAHNEVVLDESFSLTEHLAGTNGNNGINRQCGSGGTGEAVSNNGSTSSLYHGNSGSGYSFGGGAGSGGIGTTAHSFNSKRDVDTTYPMKGSEGAVYGSSNGAYGGVGNPPGDTKGLSYVQNFGCGGRLIIFCNSITNNGIITADGTDAVSTNLGAWRGNGGASGGGAIDLFYTTAVALNESNITANGGKGYGYKASSASGNGGNGCVTYSNGIDAPLWTMPNCFKPIEKYMSRDNMVYFLGELVKRMNNDI